MSLAGQKVVITGAFGNVGLAVAQTLLDLGASVAAIDHAKAPSDIPGGMRCYAGIDLSSAAGATEAMARAAADLGGIDALVNVAGTFRWETLESGSLETWDHLYNVNLRTAVAATRAALPHLLQHAPGGRIVNVGAAAAVKATAGFGPYAASKAGVAKLTEALAEELKGRGITVNAVLPGTLDTPQNRAAMPDADASRWVGTRQLANVIAFLLSPQADAVTGALIPVLGRT